MYEGVVLQSLLTSWCHLWLSFQVVESEHKLHLHRKPMDIFANDFDGDETKKLDRFTNDKFDI